MHDAEEFWDELVAQIDAGDIIPVVGPELLRVQLDGRELPLYAALAERLLAKYGLTASPDGAAEPSANRAAVALRPGHELNDAVCGVVQYAGRHVQDLYRPINDLLKGLVETPAASSLEALRDLASVSGFTVFVTTTPDDMLARAIDAERHGGIAKTDHVVFAPKLASGTASDVPETVSSGYSAVCYLFGKASPSPFVFAIHDEDTLEFIHTLQINGAETMKRLFSQLREKNLLLIGSSFPDWLSRFFIRIANTQRLADNRPKREFLIGPSSDEGGSLTFFLERFSPNTWLLPGDARQFAAELARRWREKHPQSAPAGDAAAPAAAPRRRPGETFFISYSRDDLPIARRLFGALCDVGADVAWFDKSDLRPGDDWEQKIKAAIAGCYLFLPLISANTERREEGFFREEWMQASERSRRIQGRPFIVPIVVDPDYDGNAGRFALVPESFRAAHFGHAPDGSPSDALRDELNALIRKRRAEQPA